jgi:hypothetical protein
MAQATAKDIVISRCRLVKNPTDLSTAFPHGGTALGEVKQLVVRTQLKTYEVLIEEFGQERAETLISGQAAVMAGIARGYDNDMIAEIFNDTATGATTGDQVIKYPPPNNRAGTKGSGESFVLLASPDDQAHGLAVIFFKAIPLTPDSLEINLSYKNETGFAFFFQGIRNTNGKVYQIGRIDDLDLT